MSNNNNSTSDFELDLTSIPSGKGAKKQPPLIKFDGDTVGLSAIVAEELRNAGILSLTKVKTNGDSILIYGDGNKSGFAVRANGTTSLKIALLPKELHGKRYALSTFTGKNARKDGVIAQFSIAKSDVQK